MGAWLREAGIEPPFSNRDRTKQNRDWDKHRWGIRDSFWDAKRVFRSNAENWDYQQELLDIERSKRPVKIRKTEELR